MRCTQPEPRGELPPAETYPQPTGAQLRADGGHNRNGSEGSGVLPASPPPHLQVWPTRKAGEAWAPASLRQRQDSPCPRARKQVFSSQSPDSSR